MAELFWPVLRRYGRTVSVVRAGGAEERTALVQPVTGSEEVQESGGPLGRVDERLWLYLGQGPLERGDRVVWREQAFTVQNAAEVRVGERLSHWQAVLRLEREAAG